MSNFLTSPNFRRGAAALSMVATVYAGSVACSGTEPSTPTTLSKNHCNPVIDKNCDPANPNDTKPVKVAAPTTLSPEVLKQNEAKAQQEAAENYTKSLARNERIDVLVQSAGQRFITACQTGEAGPCDIFNGGDKQWRSQTRTTQEGWAWLQHGPQYGGKDMQFSATVWVDNNWNIDATKGIKGVRFSDPNGSFGFEAPGGDPGVHSNVVINPNSWETTSMPHDQVNVATASETDAYGKKLLDMQIIDETAISLLENFQEMYQLKPVAPPLHQ